ncbi:MAG TPA: GntR family transcriptional regulator [Nocardioidaceae bacterium]|nr:GntR family transcriptional regulator [Nocardioidaceae bacterium]
MTTVASGPGPAKQQRLRERLEDLIAGLAAGEPLPAERDLARELGVARMTLRRAVDILVGEGRLIRRQGAGTFVAASKVTQRLAATSFSADMRARGLRPGSHTLSARRFPAGMMLASLLDVPPQTEVLHVRRLRLADDEPMAVEDLHVPATVAPGLTGDDLEGTSFYDLLANRFGNPVVSGTQTVEPALADPVDAGLLGVDPGSPVFLFERTSRVAGGGVAEFVRSVYRGDRYRIVVDIFPPDPAGR